jgi:hypothetical protein
MLSGPYLLIRESETSVKKHTHSAKVDVLRIDQSPVVLHYAIHLVSFGVLFPVR